MEREIADKFTDLHMKIRELDNKIKVVDSKAQSAHKKATENETNWQKVKKFIGW